MRFECKPRDPQPVTASVRLDQFGNVVDLHIAGVHVGHFVEGKLELFRLNGRQLETLRIHGVETTTGNYLRVGYQ